MYKYKYTKLNHIMILQKCNKWKCKLKQDGKLYILKM